MTRTYSQHSTPQIRELLGRLVDHSSVSSYRNAMRELGGHLASVVETMLPARKPFAVVTTPEDADYLTHGMLQVLPRERSRLVCYWTERQRLEGHADVATVIQSFVDPAMPSALEAVVIVKSVIATGCIVRTHLEQFLTEAKPKRIVIAAPVMRRGADRTLRAEFEKNISDRFEFVSFATDDHYEAGILKPGVGGQVESLLGLKGKPERFAPALIAEWRSAGERVEA